ncbi:hypothetical protein BKA62DRAFT_776405 [Auriculariales sp. MPI-PUGE-AT-0066]|nr:hypothetical protein BKA62DRAFT_776405 [Auriculariales sp. MPI-PUGE-AT-0066]
MLFPPIVAQNSTTSSPESVLSRGKVDIDEFAALDPVRQYILARTIKAKLADLKETPKRQVDSGYDGSSVSLSYDGNLIAWTGKDMEAIALL